MLFHKIFPFQLFLLSYLFSQTLPFAQEHCANIIEIAEVWECVTSLKYAFLLQWLHFIIKYWNDKQNGVPDLQRKASGIMPG